MDSLKKYVADGNSKKLLLLNGFNEEERLKITKRIINLVSNNYSLMNLNPESIFNVALRMELLGVSPELETAYIVPYNKQAQFQIGYKGLQQLAMRTGLYKKIKCVVVKESDFVSYNIEEDLYT